MNDCEPATNEARLSALLQEWVVEAPLPPQFHEHVWRRVARAETARREGFPRWWLGWLSLPLPRPALAVAYGTLMLLGVVAGVRHGSLASHQADEALQARYLHSVAAVASLP